MDEFETTDVDFNTDEESTDSSNKVAIIALAGTALVAAGTLAVVRYRRWRISKEVAKTVEEINELPEAPPAPEE